jgi:hypothetical protein
MAIRDVMGHLPDGPSSLSVRCIEFLLREGLHRSPKRCREAGDIIDEAGSFFSGESSFWPEGPDGVS